MLKELQVLKELARFAQGHKLKTISLDNLDIDLCLLDGDVPDADYILNSLEYFDELTSDLDIISYYKADLEDEFFKCREMEDDNTIFVLGTYMADMYLLEINLSLDLSYGGNCNRDPEGTYYPDKFNCEAIVIDVWSLRTKEIVKN